MIDRDRLRRNVKEFAIQFGIVVLFLGSAFLVISIALWFADRVSIWVVAGVLFLAMPLLMGLVITLTSKDDPYE